MSEEQPTINYTWYYCHKNWYEITTFTWPEWVTYRVTVTTKHGPIAVEVHFVDFHHDIGHRTAAICAIPSQSRKEVMRIQHIIYNRQHPTSDAYGYVTTCSCPARKRCYHLIAALQAYHIIASFEQSQYFQAHIEPARVGGSAKESSCSARDTGSSVYADPVFLHQTTLWHRMNSIFLACLSKLLQGRLSLYQFEPSCSEYIHMKERGFPMIPTSPTQQFPANWLIGKEFDPSEHLMKIERYDRITQKKIAADYMNVQQRLAWFIRDQRMLIASGSATTPYVIETELIELDREKGFAMFKTSIKDVLGNEAMMYGSETKQDFGDFAEKASTKSLGRALLLLGYGTSFAIEFNEGERVVDAPQESRQQRQSTTNDTKATDEQKEVIHRLCTSLGRSAPDMSTLTSAQAHKWIAQLKKAQAQQAK